MKKVDTYVQEKGILFKVQQYLKGNKTLIIIGAFNAEVFAKMLTSSLTKEYECLVYDKECTYENIKQLSAKMEKEHFDSIVGFGGGKVLDIVKTVSYFYPCQLMVIPSSASMDGACSALSVLYHEDHRFDRFLYLDKNPDVVLVDSQIIFDAPFSLLCAGMADAISSYYDFEYMKDKIALSNEVIKCAKNCYHNVYSLYQKVKQDYMDRNLSEAVECIIKTNIYDSAVAFENVGCEFSHVLANATTKIGDSKGMHGERVGVGTLFQLLLENKQEEYHKLKKMLLDLDMPVCLQDLHVNYHRQLLDYIVEECKGLDIVYNQEAIERVLQLL